MTLYARFGDAGEYEDVGGYVELVDTLRELGIEGPLERYNDFGVQCDGYTGHNYISLYYGEDVETPDRGLNDEELEYVNNALAK